MFGRACTSLGGRTLRAVAGGEDGFTLFEVLVAAVVLVIGAVGLFSFLETTLHAYSRTRDREMGTNLVRQVLEDARTVPYAQLSPSAVEGELQAMSGLADASGSAGWQIVRGGITYTLTVKECSIDDPKDGYGKHTNGLGEKPFCSESATEGTKDAQPEDLKRVTAEASWTYSKRTSTVKQVQIVTAAGEAPGLNATSLRLVGGTPELAPVVKTEPISEKLAFTVSSPTGTKAMRWSLGGTTQQPDPVYQSGTTWTFEWPIPYPAVSDGTYTVSAQAIDKTGVTGPPVSLTVTLIRGVPAAVASIRGGFNTIYVGGKPKEVVELQWKANTERNVIGYRVYTGGSLVCPETSTTLSLALSCVDFIHGKAGGGTPTYKVSAVYRGAEGALLEGPPGELTVTAGEAPAPPEKVELKPNPSGNGSVILSWTASKSPVIFYRIYRGSTDYTSRYDLTSSGSITTYTDNEANETHSYWVTAVNANLTESEPVGPVTG